MIFTINNSEEIELIVKYQNTGDNNCLQSIINKHSHFIYKIANKYDYSGHSEDDLYQEGVIALMESIKKFNPDKGLSLSKIAYPHIARTILNAAIKESVWSTSNNKCTSFQELAGEDIEDQINIERIAETLTPLEKWSIIQYTKNNNRSNHVLYQIKKLRNKFKDVI